MVNEENKYQPIYRENSVCPTQLEEFKESGAFYEDRDVVVNGNLVSSRKEAVHLCILMFT
jgi:hypothetical protein